MTDTQTNRPKQRGQLRPKTRESFSLASSHTHSAGKSCCLHLQNRPRICPLLTTSTATSLVPAELSAFLSQILHQQGNSRSRIQTRAPWHLIHMPYRPTAPQPERPKSQPTCRLLRVSPASRLLQRRAQVLTITTRPRRICHFALTSHPHPWIALFQSHQPCRCSSHAPGRVLPQGLCTCGPPCLECPSTRLHLHLLLKCHLLHEATLTTYL